MTPMPRAIELHVRLALQRMVQLGMSAPEIARHLGLPISTARDLIVRSRDVGPDATGPSALVPRYATCGPRPIPPEPLISSTLELLRVHPKWGAGRIRVELARLHRDAEIPTPRTLQRWLRQHGLAPASAGRPRSAR